MAHQSVASYYTNQFTSGFEWYKPQVFNTIFQTHGDQFLPTFQILRSMGREESVSASTWFVHEDDYIVESFTARASVAHAGATIPVDQGVGNNLWIQLDATDVDANGQSYPRVGFDVLMPNKTLGKIKTKNVGASPTYTTDLEIEPVDKTRTLGVVVVGTELGIFTYSDADGRGNPEGATRGSIKRTFSTQLFKETIGAEGGLLADGTWFEKYEDGTDAKMIYNSAFMDLDYRMALIIDGALWVGNTNTGGLTTRASQVQSNATNPVLATQGIIPTIQSRGYTFNHGGTIAYTDFDTIGTYLLQQRVTSQNIMWMNSIGLQNLIDNALFQELKNTSVDYTNMVQSVFGGDTAMAASIGFNTFRKGKYTHMFRTMENLSNPKTFGLPIYGFENDGVVIPLTKFRDPKSGASVNNISIRYKGLGTYSRRMQMFTLSGAGEIPVYTTDIDGTHTYQRSEMGLQFVKVNQCVYFTT